MRRQPVIRPLAQRAPNRAIPPRTTQNHRTELAERPTSPHVGGFGFDRGCDRVHAGIRGNSWPVTTKAGQVRSGVGRLVVGAGTVAIHVGIVVGALIAVVIVVPLVVVLVLVVGIIVGFGLAVGAIVASLGLVVALVAGKVV